MDIIGENIEKNVREMIAYAHKINDNTLLICYRLGFTPSSLLLVMHHATNTLNTKLRNSRDDSIQALFSLLSLTLKILGVYVKSPQESSEVCCNRKAVTFELLKRVVYAWIKDVIGGTVFGREVKRVWFRQLNYRGSELVNAGEELEVIAF